MIFIVLAYDATLINYFRTEYPFITLNSNDKDSNFIPDLEIS